MVKGTFAQLSQNIMNMMNISKYLKISQNIMDMIVGMLFLLEIIILFFLFHLSLNLVFDISFLGNRFCLTDLFVVMMNW